MAKGAKRTGGGGFAGVDVADDHDIDVSLFLSVINCAVSCILIEEFDARWASDV